MISLLGAFTVLSFPGVASADAVKGLYVGSDFYAPAESAQNAARVSGFNRLFLSFLHIDAEGNITYNETPIVQNGVYVGDPAWGAKLAALKIEPTCVNRIELVLGGADDSSFANVRNLIATQGTNAGSILARDLLALKNATGAEAIQFADEKTHDVSSAAAFGNIVSRLGLKVSLCPIADEPFWAALKSELGSKVDAIYLECFGDGATNDPAAWNKAFGGFKVYPGLWGNTDSPYSALVKMRNWRQTLGITGGYMWLNGFMPGDALKWSGALTCGLDSISSLRIVNKNSGKSLNLAGGGTTNGSAIRQSRFAARNLQRWMLVPSETGDHFKIVSWLSGQCASIAFSSSVASAQLWAWDYNGDPSQQFDLVDAGNGWFKIKNVRSGLVLEVAGGSIDDDAVVQQNTDTGAANQQWRLYPYGNTLLAFEDFDYPAGKLSGQDGGEGWNGSWSDFFNSGAQVLAGSLQGGNNVPPHYDSRSSGNMAFVPNSTRAGRYLDCSIAGVFGAYGYLDPNGRIGADGATLYISFLEQPAKTSLFYEFELNRGSERIAGIGNDSHTDDVNLRAPPNVFTPIGPGSTNVNFYVMRIDFQPGNDQVRVYRNPTSLTEPGRPTLTLSNAADMSFNRISLAAFANGNEAKFDQIRLANSWDEAIASAPEFAVQPADSILPGDMFRKIRISAQILYGGGQAYYLLDGNTGARVLLDYPIPFSPGDIIDAVGLVEAKNQFIDLIETTARKKGHSPLPQPRQFTAENAASSFPWIWMEGTLLNVGDEGAKQTLVLQTGAKQFAVKLPVESRAKPEWPAGCRLRVTGVLVRNTANRSDSGGEILLNSLNDIQLIAYPSWWTLKRALFAAGLLGAGLALASIWISLLHRQVEHRTRQLKREISKREKMEHERIIAEERTRISRDLHDDFGSKLTQIGLLAWLPEENSQAEEAGERLRMIGEKSRLMVSALDEVVWMMNPKNETLSSFTAYIAGYAEEFFSKTDIACRVEAPNTYPDKIITSEVRNNLFSCVKEAINNAVRHGKPSQVSLQITISQTHYTISIHDNGGGFDPAVVSRDSGMANFRERMQKNGGTCQIQSALHSGTIVTLQQPLV